ncbi:hypothetical protein evm_009754 [Chilo suppressalis]|nr:hypothetical protein evm_009754 [Chilo suppressalis]
MYHEFINEYIGLGHMTRVAGCPQPNYFLPHHGVFRDDSVTTKLRVVFNASQPTSSGKSLNDIQMTGPPLQSDLFALLLRFRQYQYVACADIEKMFRQVLVQEDQRNSQMILWRESPSEPLSAYQLNTVTYGTASAPYLSMRCVRQLGHKCTSAEIAHTILNNFYVDDYLVGHNNKTELVRICKVVIDVCKSGCFPLRKWIFNSDEIAKEVAQDDNCQSKHFTLNENKSNKTLGLDWCNNNDEFHFISKIKGVELPLTKRLILSVVSRIYDPLDPLSVTELKESLKFIVLRVQLESFPEEHKALLSKIPIKSSHSLLSLNLFLDNNNMIRVGGRLFNSPDFSYNKKHPMLLCALKRFISRRGKPLCIFSDHGRNFVGAKRELANFLCGESQSIIDYASSNGIEFKFIPPYAPHFGGLWEAGTQQILPTHSGTLPDRPTADLTSTPSHSLSRYKRIEQLRQHFWRRWSTEYIGELQTRTKWKESKGILAPDTLVLIKEDNLPPLKWRLGKILSVFPGKDGVLRVASIRTANGVIDRAFPKICPLPVSTKEEDAFTNTSLVILSLPASVAAPQSAQQAQILRHENVGEGDNHDKYTFETSDGISDQSDDKDLAVSKFFTWVDSEGVERKVKFADDQGGYQYEEEEEEGPGAPPPLILASLLGTG